MTAAAIMASTEHTTITRRRVRRAGAAAAAVKATPPEPSADANAPALRNRSDGTLASARARASSTCRGTPSRTRRHHRHRVREPLRDDHLRCRTGVRGLAGQHLVEHAAESIDVGARRAVRSQWPARDSCRRASQSDPGLGERGSRPPATSAATALAIPKSATRACRRCSRMFSGLTSRWTTPC